MEKAAVRFKRRINQSLVVLASVLAVCATLFVFETYAQGSEAAPHGTVVHAPATPGGSSAMWAYISAAIAFGLGAIGAGLAISSVGAAAMGAIAEKPEVAGQALIFVALAEGLVVFGFIMGLLILGKI